MKIAIIIITYNRPESLQRLLSSIQKSEYGNEKVPLIISIDYQDSKSHKEVVRLATEFAWKFGEKQIIEYQQNQGLREHVLKCGELLNIYDSLIVLEDDITVSPSFYLYAQTAVEKYFNDDNIAGISLYNFSVNYHTLTPFTPINNGYNVYFMNCAQSWGQVWMKQQWKSFIDWYSSNNEEFAFLPHLPQTICSWPKSSWLKYHTKYCIEQNKYFVYPYISFSTNHGDSGTHNKTNNNLFQVPLVFGKNVCCHFPDTINDTICYDGFFENKSIPNYLHIDKNNICVDLNNYKKNTTKRFLLSTDSNKPHKIIRSFGLSVRPIDANIVQQTEGKDIFLYDTSLFSNKKNGNNQLNMFLYKHTIASISYLFLSLNFKQLLIYIGHLFLVKILKPLK